MLGPCGMQAGIRRHYIHLGNYYVLLTGSRCMHVHFHWYWDIYQKWLKNVTIYMIGAFCLINDLGRCCAIALKKAALNFGNVQVQTQKDIQSQTTSLIFWK